MAQPIKLWAAKRGSESDVGRAKNTRSTHTLIRAGLDSAVPRETGMQWIRMATPRSIKLSVWQFHDACMTLSCPNRAGLYNVNAPWKKTSPRPKRPLFSVRVSNDEVGSLRTSAQTSHARFLPAQEKESTRSKQRARFETQAGKLLSKPVEV